MDCWWLFKTVLTWTLVEVVCVTESSPSHLCWIYIPSLGCQNVSIAPLAPSATGDRCRGASLYVSASPSCKPRWYPRPRPHTDRRASGARSCLALLLFDLSPEVDRKEPWPWRAVISDGLMYKSNRMYKLNRVSHLYLQSISTLGDYDGKKNPAKRRTLTTKTERGTVRTTQEEWRTAKIFRPAKHHFSHVERMTKMFFGNTQRFLCSVF